MTVQELIRYLDLDIPHAKTLLSFDPGITLFSALEKLDPATDWEAWAEDGYPILEENYTYNHLKELILLGGILNYCRENGIPRNRIPKRVIDAAVDNFWEDYGNLDSDFASLEDFYRQVTWTIEDAFEE